MANSLSNRRRGEVAMASMWIGLAHVSRFRGAVRREKWRLRALKRLILPLRNLKRRIVSLCRPAAMPGIERSILAYLASSGNGAAIEVYPSETVPALSHPFQKTGETSNSCAPAHLFELRNINFWGRYGGSVVTADNRLLADLSPEVWGTENHPIFSTFRLPKLRPLAGRTAVVVTPEAPGNYYHWIVDLLPRVALVRSVANLDDFQQILVNGSRSHYEKSSFEALGLPLDKVIYVDGRDRFQIDHATIPSMDHSSKIVAPWKVRVLRQIRDMRPETSRSSPRRIYISRRHGAVRRVLNETELAPLLETAGFAVIELESLPWIDQVHLFSNAEVVLAPHGAALANIVFSPVTTLVAEIGTRAGYRDFYLRLAASALLRYRFLEARPRAEARAGSRRAVENEDMVLDEAELRNFLREL